MHKQTRIEKNFKNLQFIKLIEQETMEILIDFVAKSITEEFKHKKKINKSSTF